jgi:hypothetical protein
MLWKQLFVFQENNFIGRIIAEYIFKECADQWRFNSRILFLDFHVQNKCKTRMFGDIRIVNAITCNLFFKDAVGNHNVSVFKVVSCNEGFNVL